MTKLLIIALLLFKNISYGQSDSRQSCKIEFYLLKTFKSDSSTTKGIMANFSVNKNDLADTAFIKDDEITGYSFISDTIKNNIKTRHMFKVVDSVAGRINRLNLPLCCGRQFALIVNGEIIYAGYFWNIFSSFGCEGITAFAFNNRIDILRELPDYGSAIDVIDTRRNQILFDCLISTKRLDRD